jgi:outer membrane protein assembly factor BamE (lipoprotein component of BamABCDE complex)|tara:strand:+ start:84 stop:509 length:426 start_codon:yes stop_codon:yes gene_type:complete
VSNCSLNKVNKHHGVRYLENKHTKITLNKSNKNDIIDILGTPPIKSTFDNDIWIYIERTTSKNPLIKLGRKKIITNNVLILEINTYGILVKKDFLNIADMNTIEFSAKETDKNYSKRSFLYNFLSSMRQKVNDPLGKRKTR